MTNTDKGNYLEDILEWFYKNYEDAVHRVPFNGRDGGYQFAPGAGPCDPLEVLREEFPDANPETLKEATDILMSEGSAWVKRRLH